MIDDEPQISGLVAGVLKDDGWVVSEARTADEAIAKLGEQAWSLVFCDVVLGGPDGYSVLRQFTEMQPNARFVLMTGHGSAAGALDATSTGAYDYLLKPFSIDDILKISAVVKEQLKESETTPDKSGKSPIAGYESDLPLIGNGAEICRVSKDGRPRCRDQSAGAHHGRIRHRQRGRRPCHTSAKQAIVYNVL